MKQTLEISTKIIIYTAVLVIFSATPAFLLASYGLFTRTGIWFSIAVALSAFFMMFLIPILVIKRSFSKSLEDFGLCFPKDLGQAVKFTALTILIFLPIIFFMASQNSFREYYSVGQNSYYFLTFSVISGGIYYFSEEFIFRGFLFFGLWNRFKFHSFWIISLIFALFHIGKPSFEVFLSFFLSLVLCYLSLKTKSFLPAFIVHFTLSLVLNLIIFFTFTSQTTTPFHF